MKVIVSGRLDDEKLVDAQQTLRDSRRAVRKVSFVVEKMVKLLMPVDTGRARASWGHWTPGDLRERGNASPGDAVWDDSKDDGLTIEQGSNVEYIEALNAGHSQQQGAGFIDRAAEKGMRELNKEIDAIMGRM